ncbi:MAG: VOC family protein [Ideonella sp.]|nr:VOC family protein [Ideonella sp.]MCC7457351.1 VOC family protein [Nitrospira sp.]
MTARIDHLVIVAASLEQGSRWCEATLGATPVAGGRHALMGTHNRLLAIGSEPFPDCYLEIIAIDPEAPSPARPRWFGIDEPALRAAVREQPRLVHAVARTRMVEMLRWGLINCGLNPGTLQAMQRDTPHGTLKWRLTLRDDGRTDCGGALPTLIEWQQGAHPCERLPPSGVALRSLALRGVPAQAIKVLRMPAVRFEEVRPVTAALNAPTAPSAPSAPSARVAPLCATLETPLGHVVLHGWH